MIEVKKGDILYKFYVDIGLDYKLVSEDHFIVLRVDAAGVLLAAKIVDITWVKDPTTKRYRIASHIRNEHKRLVNPEDLEAKGYFLDRSKAAKYTQRVLAKQVARIETQIKNLTKIIQK